MMKFRICPSGCTVALGLLCSFANGQSNSFATANANAQVIADGNFSVTNLGLTTPYSHGAAGNSGNTDTYTSDGATYITANGQGFSGPPGGGSFGDVDALTLELAITNVSAVTDTYQVNASTSSSASASIAGPGNYAFSYSIGLVYDSLFANSGYSAGFGQYSETEIQADNLLGLQNYTFTRNYLSAYNPGTTHNYASAPSIALNAGVSLSNYLYSITLAPGQTDDLFIETGEQHDDRTVTPEPASFLPMLAGMFGLALRSRRRRNIGLA